MNYLVCDNFDLLLQMKTQNCSVGLSEHLKGKIWVWVVWSLVKTLFFMHSFKILDFGLDLI